MTFIFMWLQLSIIEYLEETRPENPLLPKEPAQRAQVHMYIHIHIYISGAFLVCIIYTKL